MSDFDPKVKALELANQHIATPAEIVSRASAYHTFLTGAGAKVTAPAGKPGTTGASPTGKPGAQPTGKPPTGKPGAQTTAKPGAGKPIQPAKAAGGKHTIDEVRAIIRRVSTTDGLGKQSALDILDEEAGVTNVTNLKVEDYDKVYEACVVSLQGAGVNIGGDGEGGEAADDFDPTA
jgi:hypothetical protein